MQFSEAARLIKVIVDARLVSSSLDEPGKSIEGLLSIFESVKDQKDDDKQFIINYLVLALFTILGSTKSLEEKNLSPKLSGGIDELLVGADTELNGLLINHTKDLVQKMTIRD